MYRVQPSCIPQTPPLLPPVRSSGRGRAVMSNLGLAASGEFPARSVPQRVPARRIADADLTPSFNLTPSHHTASIVLPVWYD
jgi:hypothetical protein